MGFTPLEGIMMGTRCGSIDPAIVLFLQTKLGMKPDEIDNLLNKKSGLKGLSGISNDVRDLRVDRTERVEKTLDVYAYRAVKQIGAYIAAMGGCDAIVLTAGVGENVGIMREKIVSQLSAFDVELDRDANASDDEYGGDKPRATNISKGSLPVLVIPTNEELMIARQTRALVE